MIELNKVAIEIDGKVYQMYKMNFGFQRRLIELQNNSNKLMDSIAKSHNIEVSKINMITDLTNEEQIKFADVTLKIQEALECLFVNKDEAKVLDNFDIQNATELIKALQ